MIRTRRPVLKVSQISDEDVRSFVYYFRSNERVPYRGIDSVDYVYVT